MKFIIGVFKLIVNTVKDEVVPLHTMKVYTGGADVQLYTFLTRALGGVWSTSCLVHIPPVKEHQVPLRESGCGSSISQPNPYTDYAVPVS